MNSWYVYICSLDLIKNHYQELTYRLYSKCKSGPLEIQMQSQIWNLQRENNCIWMKEIVHYAINPEQTEKWN